MYFVFPTVYDQYGDEIPFHTFDSEDDLHAWLKEKYPTVDQLQSIQMTIVDGEQYEIEVEEIKVIKRLKRKDTYTGGDLL